MSFFLLFSVRRALQSVRRRLQQRRQQRLDERIQFHFQRLPLRRAQFSLLGYLRVVLDLWLGAGCAKSDADVEVIVAECDELGGTVKWK